MNVPPRNQQLILQALGHNNNKNDKKSNQTKAFLMPSLEDKPSGKPDFWRFNREPERLVSMYMPPRNRQLTLETFSHNNDKNDKVPKHYEPTWPAENKWEFPMPSSAYKPFDKPDPWHLDREAKMLVSMYVPPRSQQLLPEALGYNNIKIDKEKNKTKAFPLQSSDYKPFDKPDLWCLDREAELLVSMHVRPRNRQLIWAALIHNSDKNEKVPKHYEPPTWQVQSEWESDQTKVLSVVPLPEYKPFDKPHLWRLDREAELLISLYVPSRNWQLISEAHGDKNDKNDKENDQTKALSMPLSEYKPLDKPELWLRNREAELLISMYVPSRNRKLISEAHGHKNDKNEKESDQTRALSMPLPEYKPFDKPNLWRLDREAELLISMYVPSRNRQLTSQAYGHKNYKNDKENNRTKAFTMPSSEYKPFDKPDLWHLDREAELLISMYLPPQNLQLKWEALGHINDKNKKESNQLVAFPLPSTEYKPYDKPDLLRLNREAELLVSIYSPHQNQQLIWEALGHNNDKKYEVQKYYNPSMWVAPSKWGSAQTKAFSMPSSEYKPLNKPDLRCLNREPKLLISMHMPTQYRQLITEALGHKNNKNDKAANVYKLILWRLGQRKWRGIADKDDDKKPILGSSEIENSHYVDVEEDNSIRDHEAHSRNNAGDSRKLEIVEENDDTKPILGSSKTEKSHYIHIEEDNSIGNHDEHSTNNVGGSQKVGIAEGNDDTKPMLGSTETEDSYYIDIEENNSIEDHEVYSRNPVGGTPKVDLGWIFVITNFLLELPSAVFDQLSSVHKPQYALVVMLMSFAAILICIVELLHKVRQEKVTWRWRDVPWFYYPSQRHKPFGNFKDIIGLVCALCQSIVTTINYAFCLRHADSPVKVSVWPIIFAIGLLCSKFLDNSRRRITS